MFLPFLFAFITVIFLGYGNKKIGLIMWLITLLIVAALFNHHATSALDLRF